MKERAMEKLNSAGKWEVVVWADIQVGDTIRVQPGTEGLGFDLGGIPQ